MLQDSSRTHWNQVALSWHHVGPPLRPCAEDTEVMEQAVAQWHASSSNSQLQAMLCGVTPEIADMAWPPGTQLVAVERSEAMIETIWPGSDSWRQAQAGDWHNLLFDDKAFDVVIGDGIFSLNSHAAHRDLSAALRRVLKDDGLLVMRFFIQIDGREDLAKVFVDLQSGKIHSFHAFKWRLAMAIQPDTQSGISMNTIWQAWQDAAIDREALQEVTGWPQETIDTLDLYKGKETRHNFLTLNEIREALTDDFEEKSLYWPRYELGERCPIMTFRPKTR